MEDTQRPTSKDEVISSTNYARGKVKRSIFISELTLIIFIYAGLGFVYNENIYGLAFIFVMIVINAVMFFKELMQLKALNHAKQIFEQMTDDEYVTFKEVANNIPEK